MLPAAVLLGVMLTFGLMSRRQETLAIRTAGLDILQLVRPTAGEVMFDGQDLTKLGDALDTVGSAPVVPMDVPPHLQLILIRRIELLGNIFHDFRIIIFQPRGVHEGCLSRS